MAGKKSTPSSKKKKYPKMTSWVVHVKTTSNNTIVSFTDGNGNVIFGGGAGQAWFKGSKESSAYAAEMIAKQVLKNAKDHCGVQEVAIICRGVGLWRDGVFRAINELWGIDITYIKEETSIQFGGTKGIRPKRN